MVLLPIAVGIAVSLVVQHVKLQAVKGAQHAVRAKPLGEIIHQTIAAVLTFMIAWTVR